MKLCLVKLELGNFLVMSRSGRVFSKWTSEWDNPSSQRSAAGPELAGCQARILRSRVPGEDLSWAAEKLPLPQHSDGVRNRKELEAVRGVRSRTGKQVRRWLWLTLRPLYTSALRGKAAGLGRNPQVGGTCAHKKDEAEGAPQKWRRWF